MEDGSLGLIETLGLTAAIEAADAGSKAANVRFLGYERVRAGLITVKFAGDVAAIKAAVAAATAAAKRVGKVVSTHVIPRPDRQLTAILGNSTGNHKKQEESPKSVPQSASPSVAIEELPATSAVEVIAPPQQEESSQVQTETIAVAAPPAEELRSPVNEEAGVATSIAEEEVISPACETEAVAAPVKEEEVASELKGESTTVAPEEEGPPGASEPAGDFVPEEGQAVSPTSVEDESERAPGPAKVVAPRPGEKSRKRKSRKK
jgi:microcompartment protein CcmL/EutN